MNHLMPAVTRPLCLLVVATAGLAACGGGGDGPSGPAGVATVEVTAPSPTLEVGAIMIVSARYFDAAHKPLSGRTVTWASSTPAVATVSGGTVTGVTTGPVTITATVEGKNGSATITIVPVPVASIVFAPLNPAVRQGETLALAAQPVDVVGRPLDRTVTWSTADPAIATVNATSGVVSGVGPGSVYIRGEAEGKRDSVRLRVKSLNAPAITGTSQGQLTPGATGTLLGTNFGAQPNDNEVLVNGVQAAVTAASPTSVSFTVPPVTALPCTPTGPAQIMIVANADTATVSMSLSMATPRALAVGESMLFTSEADLRCNEFSSTGGKYLVTAFNHGAHAGVKTSFKLLGASASGAASVAAAPAFASGAAASLATASPDEARFARHLRAHLTYQRQDREMARRLGNPRLSQRMRRNQAALNLAVNPPPATGSTAVYRMQRTFGQYGVYDEVTFRVVYVGAKLIIYEDTQAPLANSMDEEYQRIGQEFDNVMYPLLQAFGNPLVVDSALDNNGHLIALFSPRVNNYTVAGISNAILGFVTLCDYFPRVATVVGNITIPACPASNEAEAFYSIVPNPNASSGQISIESWRRYIRGTLIHEAKHITAYAERYYRDASEVEDIWFEEATAQQASEMWARHIYNRQQFGDIGWNDGPRCDYATPGGACPDPAEAILHHFTFLYDHYDALDSKSILDDADPSKPIDPVIYGSSWSFARWLTDQQPDEGVFLRSIVQVQNDHGVQNIVSKSGRPFSELLGLWSLASLADNYPGAVINDTRLHLPSWNTRDLFAQMSANLVFQGGGQAFPRAWPMNLRQVTFGNFGSGASDVSLLPAGGFAAWELSGVQTAPQVLAVRASDGGAPPPLIGMAIVRIQ
jgi:hypothetical protein